MAADPWSTPNRPPQLEPDTVPRELDFDTPGTHGSRGDPLLHPKGAPKAMLPRRSPNALAGPLRSHIERSATTVLLAGAPRLLRDGAS
jgi:hypothetical protein